MAKPLPTQSTSWWLLLFLLATALLLPGCLEQPADPTIATATIRIGLLAPLTLPDAEETAQQMVNSARLAVQMINEAGGLLVGDRRYLVVLVVADDDNNPETAVSVAQRLINQAQVVAIIGPPFDNTAIPVAIVAERAGIPMLSPISTHPDITEHKDFVFRVTFADIIQGDALARFAREELRAQRAAVLYPAAPAVKESLAEVFAAVFEGAGGSVVAIERYTEEDEEPLSHILGRISNSRPDLLFLPGAGEALLSLAQAVRAQGLNVTLLGSSNWESQRLYAEPALEGAFFSAHFCPAEAPAAFTPFAEQYRAAYGQAPGSAAALTFDALGLIHDAIQSQSKIDPDSIRQGLYNSRYVGVTGPFFYGETGNPDRAVAIWRIAQGNAGCVQVISSQ
jgi:branched-chain amino acid transport system substrate-binding protein